MGTSKKLMLASLVSMMVVLAFGIGLVPSHDADRTSAAGSNGRIDFGQFLDMILLNEGGALADKGVSVITLDSTPFSTGDTILVPMSNEGEIDLMLSASVPGSGNDTTVTYVANEADDEAEQLAPWQTNDGVYTTGADGVVSEDGVFSDFSRMRSKPPPIPTRRSMPLKMRLR
jgi:hypothetical protein